MANHLIGRDKAQVAGVDALLAVVRKYPKIILLKKEKGGLSAIEKQFALSKLRLAPTLLLDDLSAANLGRFIQPIGSSLSRDNQLINGLRLSDQVIANGLRQLTAQPIFLKGGKADGTAKRFGSQFPHRNSQLRHLAQQTLFGIHRNEIAA